MNDLQSIILKSFGLVLSAQEIDDLHDWYLKNKNTIGNSKDLKIQLESYLSSKYKGRQRIFYEEDTSNLDYLLVVLLDQGKKK